MLLDDFSSIFKFKYVWSRGYGKTVRDGILHCNTMCSQGNSSLPKWPYEAEAR